MVGEQKLAFWHVLLFPEVLLLGVAVEPAELPVVDEPAEFPVVDEPAELPVVDEPAELPVVAEPLLPVT